MTPPIQSLSDAAFYVVVCALSILLGWVTISPFLQLLFHIHLPNLKDLPSPWLTRFVGATEQILYTS